MVDISKVADFSQRIRGEIARTIIGKEEIRDTLITALIAGGHVLIEGLPGTAKTKLSKTFAAVIGGEYKRIQMTPDMLPSDITGFYLYSPDGDSRFIEGPLFANIVLADELNRTTPRTQSALLEAMQEYQVTIERTTYPLASPFMVIATQVHFGSEGTYALTDVQLDRFMLKVESTHQSREEEMEIISNIDVIDDPVITTVASLDEIKEVQELVKQVYVSPKVVEYIATIIEFVRKDPDVASQPSMRGSVSLYKCARALAAMDGRDYVIPDDIKSLVFSALEHRVGIRPEAEMDDITSKIVLERAVEQVAVPK